MTTLNEPESKLPEVLVLLSGGVDSAACVDYYTNHGLAVKGAFVNYGQAAACNEYAAAIAIAKHYGVTLNHYTWSGRDRHTSGEIVGRNAFLALAALTEARNFVGLLALGIHSGVPYYDCSPTFVADLQRIIDGYTSGGVRIATPFMDWTKSDVWEYALSRGVPIHLAYSCERGTLPPCGQCRSCQDMEALRACKDIYPSS